MKLNLKDSTKIYLKSSISTTISLIISVIIPVILFYSNSQMSFDIKLYEEIKTLTIVSVLIGGVTTLFIGIKCFLNPLSILVISMTLLSQLIYFGYIFLWAQLWLISVSFLNFSLYLNLSRPFLLILIIPILLAIRSIYNYRNLVRNSKLDVVLLEFILNNDFRTKKQLRNHIFHTYNSNPKNKAILLSELYKRMLRLENHHPPQVRKRNNKFIVTKNGKKLLSWYKNRKKLKKIKIINYKNDYSDSIPFQIWTEKDLEKMNKNKR